MGTQKSEKNMVEEADGDKNDMEKLGVFILYN